MDAFTNAVAAVGCSVLVLSIALNVVLSIYTDRLDAEVTPAGVVAARRGTLFACGLVVLAFFGLVILS